MKRLGRINLDCGGNPEKWYVGYTEYVAGLFASKDETDLQSCIGEIEVCLSFYCGSVAERNSYIIGEILRWLSTKKGFKMIDGELFEI